MKLVLGLTFIFSSLLSSVTWAAGRKCPGNLKRYANELITFELAGGHNYHTNCLAKQKFKYLKKSHDPPTEAPTQNPLLVKDKFKISKIKSHPKYPWKHEVFFEVYSAKKGKSFTDSIEFITNKKATNGCVRPISLPKQSMLFNSCKK